MKIVSKNHRKVNNLVPKIVEKIPNSKPFVTSEFGP